MLVGATSMRLQDASKDDVLFDEDIDFIVVTSNHAHPKAFSRIAEGAWLRRIPLTFAVFQGSLLVCGPVVIRGISPCYDCYVRRDSAQMESPRMPDHEQVLRRAYDHHPELDSPGHLPTEVRLAALTVLSHIERPQAHASRTSMTSRIDSRRGMTNVIALHGCDCRTETDVPSEQLIPRQLRRMEPILKEVLG